MRSLEKRVTEMRSTHLLPQPLPSEFNGVVYLRNRYHLCFMGSLLPQPLPSPSPPAPPPPPPSPLSPLPRVRVRVQVMRVDGPSRSLTVAWLAESLESSAPLAVAAARARPAPPPLVDSEAAGWLATLAVGE
eukprot:6180961-Pleurochrysis_carterae.AAC.1